MVSDQQKNEYLDMDQISQRTLALSKLERERWGERRVWEKGGKGRKG